MEAFTVGIGYLITPNGEVVTSDGLPHGSFDEQAWTEHFGKPLTFRKATAEEQRFLTVPSHVFEAFRECLK